MPYLPLISCAVLIALFMFLLFWPTTGTVPGEVSGGSPETAREPLDSLANSAPPRQSRALPNEEDMEGEDYDG